MGSGFRIARISGIDVRVDWSWLFILLLVTWSLSALFGQAHTGWAAGMRWGLALGAALLFFASVLAHELAHSFVAKARGIPVRNITLFLFGGVSNIQRDPSSAGVEFVMAAVGPLTSLVLGAILLLVSGGGIKAVAAWMDPVQELANLGPVDTMFLWVGTINLTLGIFNLIPGFPLDGGRVFRSILWGATGNFRRATQWASWTGRLVAWAMIGGGIAMTFGVSIPYLGRGLVSGLWLAFVGWFLNNASTQSYRQVVIHDILAGVPVERIMRKDPPTVGPNSSVTSLVHDHVMGTDDYGFPVLEGDRVVGIVTLDDVRGVPRSEWDMVTVREIMTPADQLVTTSLQEDAADAMDKLTERDIRQVPVVDGDRLLGLLRRQDLVKWLSLHAKSFRGQRTGDEPGL
ncbi:MAG: site-2 protease family protein [Anaerolineae bacterium]